MKKLGAHHTAAQVRKELELGLCNSQVLSHGSTFIERLGGQSSVLKSSAFPNNKTQQDGSEEQACQNFPDHLFHGNSQRGCQHGQQ